MAKSYSEKLKDPRWQKKRLEILERDDFTCRNCGSKSETLHVHHGYYRRGADPWDYESETLKTVCEKCHEKEEWLRLAFHQRIANLPDEMRILVCEFVLRLSDDEFSLKLENQLLALYQVARWSGSFEELLEKALQGLPNFIEPEFTAIFSAVVGMNNAFRELKTEELRAQES